MPQPAPAHAIGRILVIDDDKSARLLLDRVLTRAGHDVRLVPSGEEGLKELGSHPFDAMITDKNLPGIDGLEVLRRAKASWPLVQAIVITGFPTRETEDEASELGVFGYITKPFNIQDILAICEGAVRAAQRQ